MVKRAKTRKNKSRKSKRRSVRSGRLTFPPMIPFNLCFMNVVLRHVEAYPSQAINSRIDKGIKVSDIFGGPWAQMGEVFSQVRILKVMIYALSGVGFNERGYHAINLAPKAELEITAKTDFTMLTSLPGTRTARLSRMLSAVWYPTAPDEKIWIKTNSPAQLMDWTYMSTGQQSDGTASATFPLEVYIDVHVKLRGVSYNRLKIREMESNELRDGFVDLATC